jgi:hypothetical protein
MIVEVEAPVLNFNMPFIMELKGLHMSIISFVIGKLSLMSNLQE